MDTTPKRVNIQFSIDLEQLPPEVSRLFVRAEGHAEEAFTTFSTFEYRENPLTVTSLNKIGDIRLALTKADLVLNDLENIISGFLRMQTTPVESPEVHTPSEPQNSYESEFPVPPTQPATMPPRNPFAATSSNFTGCLLYTSPSPRDAHESRMPSSA